LNMNKRSTRNNQRKQRRNLQLVRGTPSIPQFNSRTTVTRTFRFVATAAIAQNYGSSSLMSVPGMMAASATDLYNIARQAKINRVEVWAPTGTSSTPSTVSLNWIGTGRVSAREVSDISINVSEPAHISAKPGKDSLAADWFDLTTALDFFSVITPIGSVMDINLTYVLNDSTVVPTVVTVTGATIGLMYYGYADGDATHLWTPVSLSAIF
jgi:hypothetical protein